MGARLFWLTVVLAGMMGCASTDSVLKDYNDKVNFADGIDVTEAKVIAREKLINTPERRYYRITGPAILETLAAQQYPNFWFVAFGHNWFSPISTESNKTYTQLMEADYLVVIDKQTGIVQFYGEYFPKRSNDFDWVFDKSKQLNPLTPPPGVQSVDIY